ncbi:flagellar biosynthesis protein FlhA [Ruficoccus amylovorans]|uniref:Flagellar biosynthesis protein FlhA n=1 Tax=Ruficoccus amylovorans TaxID=1804625 RepID=A0A842HES6_9BACT|nr:flagellar biosynthesis protein FlhA [Ruficoccus amylovorans]MBC2595023.1 flagellar biosynthesis protein FlhA [Ruficoccus amylovorans]
MQAASNNVIPRLIRNGDFVLAGVLFMVVVIMILPVPTFVMDSLLALNLAFSALVLLVIVYVRDPISFTVFPSILLIATLFRLSLNIATTRLILLNGDAGKVVASFGEFVVGGNYIVGAVVFLILVIVNFVVITKGSGRIAEVAARFTLDAMPGKQMAIDAELNAGIIDEAKATVRRQRIQRESDFYGKMDGASKFVRGDAVAGILITLINVVAGISIGMLQRGMELADSLRWYSLLSIGDGLVSQLPALVLSLAAGLLTTRASNSQNLGSSMGRQLGFYPRAFAAISAIMLVFGLLPGMPLLPFSVLAVASGFFAVMLKRAKLDAVNFESLLDDSEELLWPEDKQLADAATGAAQTAPGADKAEGSQPGRELTEHLREDVFAVELGYSALRLADKNKGGDLLDRIAGLRRSFVQELGVLLPTVAVRDNFELEANDYRFLLRGRAVARGSVAPSRFLAMNVSGSEVELPGERTREPVFGLDATWVDEATRATAEMNGYTVVDAATVLCTHLSEVFRKHAHELIDRQMTQSLIDERKEAHPVLVNETLSGQISLGTVQAVLKLLLREGISIRHLELILEAICDLAPHTQAPHELAEHARRRLAPYFIQRFEYEPGRMKVMTLEPRLERDLCARIQRTKFEVGLALDPSTAQHVLGQLEHFASELTREGYEPVLVTMQELRLALKNFFESSISRLAVLAYQEIPPETKLESYGLISSAGLKIPAEEMLASA